MMQRTCNFLDRMERTRELPDSWDAPGSVYPAALDPVFAPCRPHVFSSRFGVSDYAFRAAAALLASPVRVRHHPRVRLALGAARRWMEDRVPGMWDALAWQRHQIHHTP
jgi:hypothetical protein